MVRITEIPHGDITGRTLMVFTQTARLMSKYIDSYFYKKTRVSFTQFMVLKIINSHNGIMNQSQIAQWTQTELHNITTLINRLKKADLVSTKRGDNDKRIVNVFLTDKGKTTLEKVVPVAKELIDRMMHSVSESDTEKLAEILEVLKENAYQGLEDINQD